MFEFLKTLKQRMMLTMKIEKLLSENKYIRDEKTRKKINLFVEARKLGNVALACKRLGVSRQFYYYWHRKLEESGWTMKGLEEASRRPKTSPRRSPEWKEDMVVKMKVKYRTYGPRTIRAAIQKEYRLLLNPSTIGNILKRRHMVEIRTKKTRKAHPKQYNLPRPGDCIQMDVKYIPYRIGANQYYLFNAIDDCTRWRFALVYENKGVWETEDFFKKLLQACPFKIRKVQTDNGVEFTYKFVSDARCIGKNPREHVLDRLCKQNNIIHKLIPVGECELNGKVERSHWTDEVDFLNRHKPFKTLLSLQKAYQKWIRFYNHERMHSSLDYMTPMEMISLKLKSITPDWLDLSNDVFAVA
jgi:transposase InsO family protein